MCGIVGGFAPKIQEKIPREMVQTLHHRGPDGSGVFVNTRSTAFLGQTRLSIIDLTRNGEQPMHARPEYHKRDGITLVYNGEVYNYREIQKELIARGYTFFSSSDTEVVLAAYIEWGKDCLKKFRGMFAFAVWDEREETLFVCRDRFGVKPLYYLQTGNTFYFASELKALRSVPEFHKEIDRNAVSYYFSYGYIPAPFSIFSCIKKVEPGHFMRVKNGLIVEHAAWWRPERDVPSVFESENETKILDGLEDVLRESFEYRMVADVDVGVFLSGGIDSSLVAALLQSSSRRLKTFTLGFSETAYNEAPAAKAIAEHLGTDHHEYYTSAHEVQRLLPDVIQLFDEPFADSSSLVTYLLAKQARQQVKVALSGDGGDELFFGYSKYEAVTRLSRFPANVRRLGASVLGRCEPRQLSAMYNRLRGVLPSLPAYSNLPEKLTKLEMSLNASSVRDMFIAASTYWSQKDVQAFFAYDSSVSLADGMPLFSVGQREQMQLWDLYRYLPDDILVKTDRTSMAVGLEAREPFLDEAVWQYVRQIPPSIRYKNAGTKYLLRQILGRHIPVSLFDRPKTGFRIPMYEWLRGPWSSLIPEHLHSSRLNAHGILHAPAVEQYVEQWNSGHYVNPDRLWILMSFALWCDTHL